MKGHLLMLQFDGPQTPQHYVNQVMNRLFTTLVMLINGFILNQDDILQSGQRQTPETLITLKI